MTMSSPEQPAELPLAGLQGPDFEEALSAIERRHEEEAEARDGWGETDEGRMYLQSVATGLAPLAGLDVEACLTHTRTFLANFPPMSLPLGDVDQRAARWLAQLLDAGSTRATLRYLFLQLAATWRERYPLAAAQLTAWAAGEPPADPTEDLPWVQALVALARTQL
jgi:hypothetical protein